MDSRVPIGGNRHTDANLARAKGTRFKATFTGVLLFTLVLYLRPNDFLPIGQFPLAKIIGAGALMAFLLEWGFEGRPFRALPKELKYLLALVLLMFLSVPLAISPGQAIDTMIEGFLKVGLVFVLIICAVNSHARLRRLMGLTVLCGSVIAAWTLENYLVGKGLIAGYRAVGAVGGMFGDPNDLALALNMLIPLAVGLGLSSSPLKTLFYLASAAVMASAVYITYSRGGFLTFVAMGGYILLRMLRRRMALVVCALVVILVATIMDPSVYTTRILSIFDSTLDQSVGSGSGQARMSVLTRSLAVFAFNPRVWLIGVGIGNFSILSIRDQVNHNAYLQVLTEMGLPAGIIYVLFVTTAFRGLREALLANDPRKGSPSATTHMAQAIRASLIAYVVGSFFLSVAFSWYLYYAAGCAVCLRQIVEADRAESRASQQHEALAMGERLKKVALPS